MMSVLSHSDASSRTSDGGIARGGEMRLFSGNLRLPDRGVHLRQHLFGEQDHVAAAELAILPVFAGEQERPEVADLLAKREDLVGDAVGRAPEDELLANRIERHVFVVLLRVGLERDGASAALQLGEKLVVIIAV